MLDRSRTPSIAVTIGHHTHLYYRAYHDGADGARFADNDHAAHRQPAGTVLLRGGPFQPRHNA